jgi:hypothetical protein
MNVPMRPEDIPASTRNSEGAPSAFLFFAGNAMFFDERGEQVPELQKEGWCGLHEFLRRYPEAPVEFHPWRQTAPFVLEREYLPGVLACIRETREAR